MGTFESGTQQVSRTADGKIEGGPHKVLKTESVTGGEECVCLRNVQTNNGGQLLGPTTDVFQHGRESQVAQCQATGFEGILQLHTHLFISSTTIHSLMKNPSCQDRLCPRTILKQCPLPIRQVGRRDVPTKVPARTLVRVVAGDEQIATLHECGLATTRLAGHSRVPPSSLDSLCGFADFAFRLGLTKITPQLHIVGERLGKSSQL